MCSRYENRAGGRARPPAVPDLRRRLTRQPSRSVQAVYRGLLVEECISIGGVSSCKVADGSWRECAADEVAGPETATGPLSAMGELCVFPAVSPPPPSRPQHEGRD